MQITMLELTDIIIHAYLKGQRDLEKATDNTKLVDAVVSHCQEQTWRQRHLRNVDKSLDEDTLTSFKKNPEPHKYEPLSSSESNICKWCNNPWNSKIHGTFGGEPIPDKAVEDKPRDHAFESGTQINRCIVCGQPWNSLKHLTVGTVGCKTTHEYHPCVLAMGHNEDHFYDMAVQIGYTERR